ncbi:MBL fold metallo-hydrolase [Barnesiella sp. An55]|uniref:MBL fold metallo-hydrolase n=1 Tax=Barnesiella sp. An55 TaxID=1965646 RepID=UPI000B373CCD|nr:MBL fold metallo-hydrolase [Barnesiella sp. An55]OUN74753.1 MBL fold hydrolase [Barnesiella sp. An55]HIZ27149.1 MBL fold metallo-hydrolase [Candidatus Barnesiella merdipullorum]
MKITRFYFNMLPVNCYVLWNDNSRECAIVDAGCYYTKEEETLARFISDNQLTVKYLLATHLHFDHCFGNAFVAQKYGVSLCASQADEFLLQLMPQQCQAFGIPFKGKIEPIGQYIDHGDTFVLGQEEIRAIAVPGHSPGSLAFYVPESGFVLTGDALFQLSIGRTDFPGGNHRQLIESIHKNLLTLPSETVVYPGHGPETEIGIERTENPFL